MIREGLGNCVLEVLAIFGLAAASREGAEGFS